jgi:hypothetical protein
LLLGYIGDLALSEGDVEEAVEHYQEGLSLLAGSGGYGVYTLMGHLERKEQRWREWVSEGTVSVDALRRIGKKLEQYWIEQELTAAHVQILPFFARWKRWKGVTE